jgi:hypothetical protein
MPKPTDPPSITHPEKKGYLVYIAETLRKKGVSKTWIESIHRAILNLAWDGSGMSEVTLENLDDFNPNYPLAGAAYFKHAASGRIYKLYMTNKDSWKPGKAIRWSFKEVVQ